MLIFRGDWGNTWLNLRRLSFSLSLLFSNAPCLDELVTLWLPGEPDALNARSQQMGLNWDWWQSLIGHRGVESGDFYGTSRQILLMTLSHILACVHRPHHPSGLQISSTTREVWTRVLKSQSTRHRDLQGIRVLIKFTTTFQNMWLSYWNPCINNILKLLKTNST